MADGHRREDFSGQYIHTPVDEICSPFFQSLHHVNLFAVIESLYLPGLPLFRSA